MGSGTGWPLDAALLHAGFFLLGVLLPGAALLSFLPPEEGETGGPLALLRLAAAGVLWNTLLFGAVLLFRPSGPLPRSTVLGGVAAATAVLVVSSLVLRRARLRTLLVAGIRGVSPLLAGLALLCGLFSTRAFPHVADCLQLHWTENLVAGNPAGGNSGALGFSAWILFPGLVRADLPLVSSGAAARLPLFLLAFVAAHALVVAAKARRVAFGTGLLILTVLASHFGRIGLVEFGKDSLFGLVFAMAYVSALPRGRPGEGRRERGLFFAASVLLGVITFPFLALLSALDLASRLPEGGVRSEFRSLALFAVPAALPAIAVMSRSPLALIAATLAVAVLLAFALPERPARIAWAGSGALIGLLPASFFVALAVAGALLMPIRLLMTTRFDSAHRAVLEAWAPLDGRTSFASYLLTSGGLRFLPVAVVAILGVLAYLLRRPERRDPSFTALALAPLVLSLLGLSLALLPIRPIRPFHVWDLVKDVPLWLMGPFWGLFAVLAVDDACGRLLGRLSDRVLALALGVAVFLGVVAKRHTLPTTFRPAVLTAAAGHQDGDVAALWQEVWDRRADTRSILAERGSLGGRGLPELMGFSYCGVTDAGETSPADVAIAPADLPALVVVDPSGARRLLAKTGVRVVRRFEGNDDLLLRIPAAESPSAR